MHIVEDHTVRTMYRRAALEALLDAQPVDDKVTTTLLDGILTNYWEEASRWRDWEALVHLYDWHRALTVDGGDVHAYGLGDGVHYEADLEGEIEKAEAQLNEALDKVAGPQVAPYVRKAA